MKKIIFLFIFLLCLTVKLNAQAFLAVTTQKVQLREGPGKNYSLLMTIPKNSTIFVYSEETINGYYHIIDIDTDTEGYIPEGYTKYSQKVSKTTEKIFSQSGSITSENPEVTIYNKTSKKLTLKLNSTSFVFTPQERSKITITPGVYNFIASAPGVIPLYGSEYFNGNSSYEWKFWIETRRR
jgi:uncharacterized protein YgiM (DUF1202 family)